MAIGIMNIVGFGLGDLDHELHTYAGNAAMLGQSGASYPTYQVFMQGANATPGSGSFEAVAQNGVDNGDKYILGIHGFFASNARSDGDWDYFELVNSFILRRKNDTGSQNWVLVDTQNVEYVMTMTGSGSGNGQYLEIIFDKGDNADVEAWFGGVKVLDESGVDTNGGNFADVNLISSEETPVNFGLYSYYLLSGATDASDRVTYGTDDDTWDVIAYANANAGDWLTDAFDVGTSTNCQTIPASTATEAEYTGTPRFGTVVTDDASPSDRSGPKNDSDILNNTSLYGFITRGRYDRNGGGATDHYIAYGNDRVGGTSEIVIMPASYGLISWIWTNATYIPLSTDYIRHGLGVIGAQDLKTTGFLTEILHRPISPPSGRRIFNIS